MNNLAKTSLKLVRSYSDNRVLIDLTKIAYFKLRKNYIQFYSDKPSASGAFIGVFGFMSSSNKNCIETIYWESDKEAKEEYDSIQTDLNRYYNNIGTVRGVNQN
jgi:hypothetical protein